MAGQPGLCPQLSHLARINLFSSIPPISRVLTVQFLPALLQLNTTELTYTNFAQRHHEEVLFHLQEGQEGEHCRYR